MEHQHSEVLEVHFEGLYEYNFIVNSLQQCVNFTYPLKGGCQGEVCGSYIHHTGLDSLLQRAADCLPWHRESHL